MCAQEGATHRSQLRHGRGAASKRAEWERSSIGVFLSERIRPCPRASRWADIQSTGTTHRTITVIGLFMLVRAPQRLSPCWGADLRFCVSIVRGIGVKVGADHLSATIQSRLKSHSNPRITNIARAVQRNVSSSSTFNNLSQDLQAGRLGLGSAWRLPWIAPRFLSS